jgi:hypothetical protein
MSRKRKTEFFRNPGLSRAPESISLLLTLMRGESDEAFVSPRHPPREIAGGKDHAPLTFHFGNQLGRPNMVLGSGGGNPVVKWT